MRTHGGGLTGGYKPVQFHFHWGADNTRGSEHVLDNKHYPMEVRGLNIKHLVRKGVDRNEQERISNYTFSYKLM